MDDSHPNPRSKKERLFSLSLLWSDQLEILQCFFHTIFINISGYIIRNLLNLIFRIILQSIFS